MQQRETGAEVEGVGEELILSVEYGRRRGHSGEGPRDNRPWCGRRIVGVGVLERGEMVLRVGFDIQIMTVFVVVVNCKNSYGSEWQSKREEH